MKSRRALLEKSKLYVILDAQTCPERGACALAGELSGAGVDIVQYRNKTADRDTIERESARIRDLLADRDTLFIVNDYPDIARAVDADGVHLGQDDMSCPRAREIIGDDRLIGVSTHSIDQAKAAVDAGADYLGFGPLFATPTKPAYQPIGVGDIAELAGMIRIPFFAIGDINTQNIRIVRNAGAERFAVCRAILRSADVRAAVEDLKLGGVV